jgi:hypothetical protein
MKKSAMVLAILAVMAWGTVSYGRDIITNTLIYKGVIKASSSVFDANNPVKLSSENIKAYFALQVSDEADSSKGRVVDSNAVIYDKRNECFKVLPIGIQNDPCDPCGIVMLHFTAVDVNGSMYFYAVGKGKLTKLSNDTSFPRGFAPQTFKGTGTFVHFAPFDPAERISGPMEVTMTLDQTLTKSANPDLLSADSVINEIVSEMLADGWTRWSYVPLIS